MFGEPTQEEKNKSGYSPFKAQRNREGLDAAKQEIEAATAAYESTMSAQGPAVAQQYVRQTPKAAMYQFGGGPVSGQAGGMASPYAQPHAAGQPLPTASMAGPGMASGQLAGMYTPLAAGGEGGGGGGAGSMAGVYGGEIQGMDAQGPDLQGGQGVGTPGAAGAAGGPWDEKPEAGATLSGEMLEPVLDEQGNPVVATGETKTELMAGQYGMGQTDFYGEPWSQKEVQGAGDVEAMFGIGWEGRDDYTEFIDPNLKMIEDMQTESDMSIQQAQAAGQRNLNATLSQSGMDPGSTHIQGIKLGAYWQNVQGQANREINRLEQAEIDRAAKQKYVEDDEYAAEAQDTFDNWIGQYHATGPGTGGILTTYFGQWAERQYLDMVSMGASSSYINKVMTSLETFWIHHANVSDVWAKPTYKGAEGDRPDVVPNLFASTTESEWVTKFGLPTEETNPGW